MPERLHYLINFPHPTLFIFATGEDLLLNCNLRKILVKSNANSVCICGAIFLSFLLFPLSLKKKNPEKKSLQISFE